MIDTFNKSRNEEKKDGNATERLKNPMTAKTLARNKTTANFLTSRRPKDDDEVNHKSEKAVNQSMNKGKKGIENLHTVNELSRPILLFNFVFKNNLKIIILRNINEKSNY